MYKISEGREDLERLEEAYRLVYDVYGISCEEIIEGGIHLVRLRGISKVSEIYIDVLGKLLLKVDHYTEDEYELIFYNISEGNDGDYLLSGIDGTSKGKEYGEVDFYEKGNLIMLAREFVRNAITNLRVEDYPKRSHKLNKEYSMYEEGFNFSITYDKGKIYYEYTLLEIRNRTKEDYYNLIEGLVYKLGGSV